MDSKELKFKAMIARLPHERHKSGGVISKILNMTDYSAVYIIDDLFEGRGTVWSKAIPPNFKRRIKFCAFPIPQFVITTAVRPSPYKAAIGRWLSLRAADHHLHNLNISKTTPMKGNSIWDTFGVRKSKMLSTTQKSKFQIKDYPIWGS